MEFSLLTSIYSKESPERFAACIEGVLRQTVLPNEWVIVMDGPLTPELDLLIASIDRRNAAELSARKPDTSCAKSPTRIRTVQLPATVTQGPARAKGLVAASHEWVAILDSDDVCRPDRFEKQLKMIANDPSLSIIGGQIAEFSGDISHPAAKRLVPTRHADILRFMKSRNPFNTMTVMLRRSRALEAGNFACFPGFEDYDLWARMAARGAVCANHPDILADAFVGGGVHPAMHSRRRGIRYARYEWLMQRRLRGLGLIGWARFALNLAMRLPLRLLPERAVAAAYGVFARTRTGAVAS